MAADPAIAAALRAAAFAACGCGGMCFKTDGAMYCEAREDHAAAAIAAFLRALPDDPRGDVAPILLHGQGERLAAAVEEAARDA